MSIGTSGETRGRFWQFAIGSIFFALALWLVSPVSIVRADGPDFYVDADAPGPSDGLSWTTAYTELQSALAVAVAGEEIWVAEGTYRPDFDGGAYTDDVNATFVLTNGVALYGGFGGYGISETQRSERDWGAYEVTLSGNLGGNVAYHVVSSQNVTPSAILDGFIITAGAADGSDLDARGGGLLNIDGAPTLHNLAFVDNYALMGGAMYNENATPTLVNVMFKGNVAEYGGGMYNITSTLVMTNVTLGGNVADPDGGGMYNVNTDLTLVNSILWRNFDRSGYSLMAQLYDGGDIISDVTYSTIQGWDGGGEGNSAADPRFVRDPAIITGSMLIIDDAGDLHIQEGSPAIDAGNDSAVPGDIMWDLDHYPRVVDAAVDQGAYEAVTDVSIDKTASPEPVIAGRSVVYTLTVTNRGTLSATNVVVSDTLPYSSTLHTVDQTDDNQWDFNAGDYGPATYWHDVRPWPVRADDWLAMTPTITSTAVFTSRVFDAFNVVDWTQLRWTPRRPSGKALPNDGQIETAYELGNANMTGNEVLLHLDDPDTITPNFPFRDSSGLNNYASCPAVLGQECPSRGVQGRFERAVRFDGTLSQTMRLVETTSPDRTSIEFWVRPSVVTDTSFILRTDAVSDTIDPGHYSHLLGIQDGRFRFYVQAGGEHQVTGTNSVTTDTWYHVVGTAQSGGELKLYINGREQGRVTGLGDLWGDGTHYRLGSRYGPTTTAVTYFSGDLDEVAIYSRTLSSAEVLDHYLRGALQMGFQVRTCDDVDCDGEAFVGPGGVADALYSEQDAAFSADGMPLVVEPLNLADNRYFQYQVTMMSEDVYYAPQLRNVSVGPVHRVVTATQGSCVATSRAFTCAVGTLAGGESVTVSTSSWIWAATLGTITNTVTVTTASQDVDVTNNSTSVTSTVEGEVDLVVLKTDDEWYGGMDPVSPGSLMTYTLQVRNVGPSVARFVTVTDMSPGQVVTAVASAGWDDPCQVSGKVVTCTAALLGVTGYNWQQVYDWEHITITAYAPITTGVITNTAWVTAVTAEAAINITDNMTIETTLITPVADVDIDKDASHTPVDPGTTLTYTLQVTNRGPYTATNVVVTDTLPDGLTGYPIGDSDWSCDPPANRIVCTLNDPLTHTFTATIQITVTAPSRGFLVNSAHVTAEQYDIDPNNNWDAAYTAVRPVADLSISKSGWPDPVYAAQPLTYTLTVTNAGPVPAGQVTTSLRVNNGIDFDVPLLAGEATPYRTSMYINNVPGLMRNITVTLFGLSHSFPSDLGVLLVGPGNRNVVLLGNAGGGTDALDLDLAFNNEGVAVSEPMTDTDVYRPTNNGLLEDFPAPAPSSPYGGSLAGFYGASPNGVWRLYVYDYVYSDEGSLDGWRLEFTTVTTDTIVVTDTLHSGMTILPPISVPSGWSCSGEDTGTLECESDYLDVNEPVDVSFVATAPDAGGVITNTASVTSTTTDIYPISNTVSITTTVVPVSDLAIRKQVEPEVTYGGSLLTYTLTISNAGPSDVISVTVTDFLPEDLREVTVSQGTCAPVVSSVLTCSVDSMLVGAMQEIVLHARAPLTPGLITNTAHITSTLHDSVPDNNVSEIGVEVVPPLLFITKTVMPSENVPYHGTVTYTVVLTNDSGVDVSHVMFSDTVPSLTTFARWVEQPLGAGLELGPPEVLTWTGTVLASQPVTLSFVVSHTGDYGDVVQNTAAYAHPSGSEGEATTTFTVLSAPSLAITKTLLPMGELDVGASLTYSVILYNHGASEASGVLFTDTLPVSTTFAAWVERPAGAALDAGPPEVITWQGSVQSYQAVTLTFVMTHTGDYEDVVPNTAHYAYALGTGKDTVTFTVKSAPQLHVTKHAYPDAQIRHHDEITYTVSVYNSGASDALGVWLTDTLPVSTTFVRWVDRPASVALDAGPPEVITWNGRVQGHQGVTLTFVVAHTGAYGDVVVNTARYRDALSMGSDTVTITVVGEPQIVLTKTVGTEPTVCASGDRVELPIGGGDVVYCYTVENTGQLSLTRHTLVDSHLGTLLSDFAYDLLPGETTMFTVTETITETTVNTAEWTAYNPGPVDAVTATDTATVYVQQYFDIYLPLVMHKYVKAPDLVVDSVVVTGDRVTVTIRNQGDWPVEKLADNEFWVDVYVGLLEGVQPPQAVNETWRHTSPEGLVWGVTVGALPLMPGDVLVLTAGASGGPYPYFFSDPEYSLVDWPIEAGTQVWAQVDSANKDTTYGAVYENHEIISSDYNNVFGPVTAATAFEAVDFELRPLREAPVEENHLPARP